MEQEESEKSLLIEDTAPVRQDPRLLFATHALLVLDDGLELTGETKDVSFSGAFLATETAPPAGVAGSRGVIRLALRREGVEAVSLVSFPCAVARVSEAGLGLTFREEEG